jgi:hypothetical protein
MKRVVILLPVLLALQVGVQPALAWTWPVEGPVLQPFTIANDPYRAGQHRGLDTGAQPGAPVRAPAAGTVSFAGTAPGGGRTVTIQTGDGYSVTLVHLGTIETARSAIVAEGDRVGTVGPSGDPEYAEPYVHLGIRLTADPNGYVDPLGFLPARPERAAEAPEPAPQPAPAHAGSGHARQPETKPVLEPTAAPSAVRRAARPRARAPVPPELTPGRTERRPAREEVPRQITLARDDLRSFERPVTRASSDPLDHTRSSSSEGLFDPVPWGIPAAILAAVVGLALLRRELRDAVAADRAAPMLLELTGAAAEDARGLGLRQEDRLVMHRDLERLLLAEAEPLSDLDRDDDASELVEVADDAGRHAVRRPGGCRRLSRPHGPGTWPFSAGAHA